MCDKSDALPDHVAGKLEEYKALRQELMWNTECQIKERDHCLILSAALIGYALANSAPALYFVAWFIVFRYWQHDNNYRRNVAKISRYIAEFLDGNETGLHWSTRVGMAEKQAVRTRAIGSQNAWRRRRIALLTPYSFISLTCLLLLVTKGLPSIAAVPRWGLILLCVCAFAANTVLTFFLLSLSTPALRKKWQEVWKRVRKEELNKRSEDEL